MSDMKIKSNRIKIQRQSREALLEAGVQFNQAMKDVFNNPYYWVGFENSVTRRQNGQIVAGAFRNIFDTGELANSQVARFGTDKVEYAWTAEYASSVFFGHRTGNMFIPGRNWVQAALDSFDVSEAYVNAFKSVVVG